MAWGQGLEASLSVSMVQVDLGWVHKVMVFWNKGDGSTEAAD